MAMGGNDGQGLAIKGTLNGKFKGKLTCGISPCFESLSISSSRRHRERSGNLAPIPRFRPHSFISYRLAMLGDENRVAMEAGHSPAMIYRNYRVLVT